jgi:hypothetical protein
VLGDLRATVWSAVNPRLVYRVAFTSEAAAAIGWAVGLLDDLPAQGERLGEAAPSLFPVDRATLESLRARARFRPEEEVAARRDQLEAGYRRAEDAAARSPYDPEAQGARSRALERVRGLRWIERGGDLDFSVGPPLGSPEPAPPEPAPVPPTARAVVDRVIGAVLAGDLAVIRSWDGDLSPLEGHRLQPVFERLRALRVQPRDLRPEEVAAVSATLLDRDTLRDLAARRVGATALAWSLGWSTTRPSPTSRPPASSPAGCRRTPPTSTLVARRPACGGRPSSARSATPRPRSSHETSRGTGSATCRSTRTRRSAHGRAAPRWTGCSPAWTARRSRADERYRTVATHSGSPPTSA